MLLLTALLAVSSSYAADLRVVGSLLQVSSLTAGQGASGSITLYNDGTAPVEVVVYPLDLPVDESATGVQSSNRAWLQLTRLSFKVDAGASTEVPYRVEVPADAQATGTFSSVLVIEAVPLPAGLPLADAATETESVGYKVGIVTHVRL